MGSATGNLLINLVRRDLTVRYKSTVLGFFWSFIKPLALTAIFWVVFDKILKVSIPEGDKIPFALFLLTGLLAWTFFAGATGEAMQVILANGNMIRKVRLPLFVFPLATVCSHMIHFLLALLVLGALLIVGGLPPGPAALLVIPVLLLQFVLVYALALLLSSLNVFYRDVASVWEVLLTAWLYATPIIYPLTMAMDQFYAWNSGWLKWLYLANPMAPIILTYRRLLLYAPLAPAELELPSDGELVLSLLLSAVVTGVLLLIGWWTFRKFSRSFADEL